MVAAFEQVLYGTHFAVRERKGLKADMETDVSG
jgi:hypothetical protein